MIDKRELKLGDWVSLKGKLNKIVPYDFVYYADKDFESIHLTEEILLKAGFEKDQQIDDMYYFNLLPEFYIRKQKSGEWLAKANYGFVLSSIKYLHQLQNLIFALTGTELNIDLSK